MLGQRGRRLGRDFRLQEGYGDEGNTRTKANKGVGDTRPRVRMETDGPGSEGDKGDEAREMEGW